MVSTRRAKKNDNAEDVGLKNEVNLDDEDVLVIDEAETDSDSATEVQPNKPIASQQTSKGKAKQETSSDDSSTEASPNEKECDSDDINLSEELELVDSNDDIKPSPKKAPGKLEESSKKQAKPALEVLLKRKIEEIKTEVNEAKKVRKEQNVSVHVDYDEDQSDDDAPLEVSSKKVVAPDIVLKESDEPEMSLFEQVQAKKQELADRKAGIKEKEKERKIKRKQLRQGEFLVKAKQSQFKVITLNKGLSKKLEPERNFKAELLASRTADRRVKDVKATLHRSKWGGRFD